ncbi:hypothetical protein LX87_04350 [Larkinella arboricola]|uniref:Uncharacterized protein n=1 Tax=Larkinella arboricola TaxID=643671 RepID=A0A327WS09_LARAB|nr:hypothetical protein [Larkinella arboricola]RAJ94463.1 hypothetical protein LX87_04350 [Larkinella arboricola]
MQKILLKSLYLIASIKYPKVRSDLRYFIRDNYYCRLNQVKYIFKDYFVKKKYKIVNYQGEFDQELRYILPFAYWHHVNGTLERTVSCKDMKEFYFFSKNHEERYTERIWQAGYNYYEVPNMTHSNTFDYSKWLRVPLKKQYANSIFLYDKPALIIANKYNIEWDKPPVNYLDLPILGKLITSLKDRYQIIYNRPLAKQIVGDNSEILDLNEYAWIREAHPEVLLMNDLYERHSNEVNNFNHLQLLVYANCNRFISMHGGTAAFASYFEGINIILSAPGNGMEHHFNEFETIFPQLSGAKILHAKNREEVLQYVNLHY